MITEIFTPFPISEVHLVYLGGQVTQGSQRCVCAVCKAFLLVTLVKQQTFVCVSVCLCVCVCVGGGCSHTPRLQ